MVESRSVVKQTGAAAQVMSLEDAPVLGLMIDDEGDGRAATALPGDEGLDLPVSEGRRVWWCPDLCVVQ
jgi:hypothetical protein